MASFCFALLFWTHIIFLSSHVSIGSRVQSQVSLITNCSENVLANGNATGYSFCIDDSPANRSWYSAMASCRFFGGELLSLDGPENKQYIEEQIKSDIVAANDLFVNAHKHFYSENGKFSWSSGSLVEDLKSYDEECVLSRRSNLTVIKCEIKLMTRRLICQKTSLRMYVNYRTLTPLLATSIGISHKTLENPMRHEVCKYYSFLNKRISWFESKVYCEQRNSELLGVPYAHECALIQDTLELNGNKPIYLNLHQFIYSRNFTEFTFRDVDNKSMKDNKCNFSTFDDVQDENLCIHVDNMKRMMSTSCIISTVQKTFICKQCSADQRDIPAATDAINNSPDFHVPTRASFNDNQIPHCDQSKACFCPNRESSSSPLVALQYNNTDAGISKRFKLVAIIVLSVVALVLFIAVVVLLYFLRRRHVLSYSKEYIQRDGLDMHVSITPALEKPEGQIPKKSHENSNTEGVQLLRSNQYDTGAFAAQPVYNNARDKDCVYESAYELEPLNNANVESVKSHSLNQQKAGTSTAHPVFCNGVGNKYVYESAYDFETPENAICNGFATRDNAAPERSPFQPTPNPPQTVQQVLKPVSASAQLSAPTSSTSETKRDRTSSDYNGTVRVF